MKTKSTPGPEESKSNEPQPCNHTILFDLTFIPHSVSEKSFDYPRHVATTHNNHLHLVSDRYGSDRHSPDWSSSSSALRDNMQWSRLKTGSTTLTRIKCGLKHFVRLKWRRKTHPGQKSPKSMNRNRAITLFFWILRQSPDSVSEKSFDNPRHVASTHNSRPHLASGRYGSHRGASNRSNCNECAQC